MPLSFTDLVDGMVCWLIGYLVGHPEDLKNELAKGRMDEGMDGRAYLPTYLSTYLKGVEALFLMNE